jgi:antitoxin (DNA-binding transcriptional repressor) of toxin-antitoxin stability system
VAQKPVTYRDLRNTPGQVFERLATGEPLPLVADGTTKALIVPVEDGDVATALEAWRRGNAQLALARIQADARRSGVAKMPLSEINKVIKTVRKARRRREAPSKR